MSHINGMRAEVDRAKTRVQYARRELTRAEHNVDNGDPRAERTLRKLEEDLARAEKDCAWAEHRLADAMMAKLLSRLTPGLEAANIAPSFGRRGSAMYASRAETYAKRARSAPDVETKLDNIIRAILELVSAVKALER